MDASKAPDLKSWREYIERLPIPEELREWFPPDTARTGIGFVMGPVSGGLECLDFDDRDALEEYGIFASDSGIGELWARVTSGYQERTPNGAHVLYYCPELAGNQKLAQRPGEGGLVLTRIETRSTGGYIVAAPSHGGVHRSGEPYELILGGVDQIETITPEEREQLLGLARAMDRLPEPVASAPRVSVPTDGTAPGDLYNNDASITTTQVLVEAGWTLVSSRNSADYLRRPGKSVGISASVGHIAPGIARIFTTSTVLEAKSYDKFGIFAEWYHGGDFAAAGRELYASYPQYRGAERLTGSRANLAPGVTRINHDDAGATSAATSELTFHTAREIAAMTPEEPDWFAAGFLAPGSLTDLTAKIKDGKTNFALRMLRAIRTGSPFLDRPTRQARVVYLTEERQSSLAASLRRTGLEEDDGFHILLRQEARGLPWPEVVSRAVEYCREVDADILAVDTFSDWSGLAGDDENSAGAAGAALVPLQEATEAGLAVLMLRHDRKGGGEVGESGRGSSAIGGKADIILGLRNARVQGHETRRTIKGIGRYDAIPEELVFEIVEGEYVCLGTQEQSESSTAQALILEILPDTRAEAMSADEVIEATGGRAAAGTLKRALTDLSVALNKIRRAKGAGGASSRGYGYWIESAAESVDEANEQISPRTPDTHARDDSPRTYGSAPTPLITSVEQGDRVSVRANGSDQPPISREGADPFAGRPDQFALPDSTREAPA